MKKQDIVAIVVSYNGEQKTLRAIHALQGRVGHVHVVDNGSDAVSRCYLETLLHNNDVSITWLGKNTGIGAALNIGVQVARLRGFRWILTMDQDSTVDSGMVAAFCRVVHDQNDVICLCPTIEGIAVNSKGKIASVPYAITSGNLVRIDIFDEIGYYNEPLFIDGVDFDFSLRVRLAGYKIIRVGDALMYHELGESVRTKRFLGQFHTVHSPLRRYYIYRNYLYLFRSYVRAFPLFIFKLIIVYVLSAISILIYGPHRSRSVYLIFQGIRDYICNRFGAYREW